MTEVAETRLGPVQYASIGDGAPVLVLHGSPGGYDQAVAMARFLPPSEFRAIAVSRPGYLGTPLGEPRTIDQEADLHAALLDQLGIDRAGVLCWSGGGPAGYRLAVRHPGRVGALVALAAVSKAIERAAEDMPTRFMFHTRAGDWLLRVLAAHAPDKMVSSVLESEGSLTPEELEERAASVFADEDKRRFVLDVSTTVSQRGSRRAGVDNDYEQFAAIGSLELENIAAPTLIVQGSADTDVTPDHSEDAAAAIPGAELLVLDRGTHLAFYTHPDAAGAQARAMELLR